MKRVGLVMLCAFVVLVATAAAKAVFPETIPLPDGFRPEGISIGNGTTFYVGSIPTGAVYRGDLRTGEGSVLVAGAAGRAAIGVEFDRGLLYVAGGPTGKAFVYDAETGALELEVQLAQPPAGTTSPSFVNDVVVTREAAYFTDSRRAVLYRLPLGLDGTPAGTAELLPLTGDFELVPNVNNLNGIEATPDGSTLVVAQSSTGLLLRVDPTTGVATEIDLGGVLMTAGDGLLLKGRTLYVVQNRLNQIAVVRLDGALSSGTVVRTITDRDFDVPTTIDRFGSSLYAVNARFGTASPDTASYSVVRVDR